MARTIFALFDDVLAALRVATALEREGYDRSRMSVLAPDPRGKYSRPSPGPPRSGSGGGAIFTFAPTTIPGLGSAAVAGPLAPAVTDADAATGGLVGSLTRLGFADPDARHYHESLRRGQALFAVETPESRVRNAVETMRRLGARAVDETVSPPAEAETHAGPAPARESGAMSEEGAAAAPAPAPEPRAATEAGPVAVASAREGQRDQVTVPVVEEQLEVGKRQVNRGGVRIRSHIVEQPIREDVRLREERVTVERRPVSREATEEDLADFKEGSIEIHETVEEAVVVKRRRVVEEVVIGRETSERTETISDIVRKTQVDVEPLASPDAAGSPAAADDFRGLHEATAQPGERFEHYEPAYRYGAALARDERFRDAQWSDVEPHARREWEQENAGTWDQFRKAVRRAWHKVGGR